MSKNNHNLVLPGAIVKKEDGGGVRKNPLNVIGLITFKKKCSELVTQKPANIFVIFRQIQMKCERWMR